MRLRVLLSCLLAAGLLAATPARAEEEHPGGVDAAEVALRMLSTDPAERARGVEQLLRRIAAGGDVAGFVGEVARIQAGAARDAPEALDRFIDLALHGTRDVRNAALERVVAGGPESVARLLETYRHELRATRAADEAPPAPAGPPVPSAPTMEPSGEEKSDPEPPEGGPACEVEGSLFEVAAADARRFFPDLGEDALPTGDGAPRVSAMTDDETREKALEAARIPDAVPLRFAGSIPLGRRSLVLRPREVSFREEVRRREDGAWEVVTGTLPTGWSLTLAARAAPDQEGAALEVELSHARAPAPLATTRVKPESGVEAIEIDRPEWELASSRVRTTLPGDGGGVLVLFPGLSSGPPDRSTILVLSVHCPR